MTRSSQVRLLIFATVSSSIDTIKRLLEFERYSLCVVGLLPDPDKMERLLFEPKIQLRGGLHDL